MKKSKDETMSQIHNAKENTNWRAKAEEATTGPPNNSFAAFGHTKHQAFPGRKSASMYTCIQLDYIAQDSMNTRQSTGYQNCRFSIRVDAETVGQAYRQTEKGTK